MPKPRKFTPRARNRFRSVEVARAIRAARAAGGERVEIDPQTGKISVIIGKSETTHAADQKRTPGVT